MTNSKDLFKGEVDNRMVFYYSRGKKTKIFAHALGEFLGKEVYELESDLNDKGKIGFFIKLVFFYNFYNKFAVLENKIQKFQEFRKKKGIL